jgi:FtsP/CotA-like multicopper oxidase with cupredoxin domain
MFSRYRAAQLAIALAITVLVAAAGTQEVLSLPVASPTPARQEGQPLRDPPQYVSSNGLLRVRVVVERHRVDLAGRRLWALTYNGSYMPPTLRLHPGDRLDLTMVNQVRPYTNLHLHGLHVSPAGNSDDVFIHIHPGKTFHYVYQFPRTLTPGTYWYHSHAHPYAAPQVAGGMSGIIIVDGLQRYLPPDLAHITEHVIALKDFQVRGDEIRTENLHIGAPTTRTVDGQLTPTIRIRPGETQLWRLANISANIYYRLHLQGQRFHVIAQDGSPVFRVWSADSLVIPAGARYDVLVQGGPAGRTPLETLPYNTGPAGNSFPRQTLATVVSTGAPMRPAALPTSFAPRADLSGARIAARRTLVFSENSSGTQFYINGKQFNENRVDFRARLNTVEEWTVRNDSNEQHSFHVHTNRFQVTSIDGRPYHASSLQDTVNLPAEGAVTVRIHFTDFTGRTVLHCHILNHEDAGMMAVLEIVP